MAESVEQTKTKILESAKKEFLEKGFTNASLRTIASNAGLTTGAMYRHFKDKDDLFCALVDDAIEFSQKIINNSSLDFHLNSPSLGIGAEHMKEEEALMKEFLDYIYDNFDAFTLLLSKSAGSTHENFLDETCEIYTDSCFKIVEWMKDKFNVNQKIDRMAIHVLATTIVNAFAEIIYHKMEKQEAINFINNVSSFFHFGFMHMLGLPCDVHEHQ